MKPLVERLVSEKFTVVRPVAAAVTVYGPPAVAGAVNVTFTPETGLLPASFTVTASALAKAVLIVADCGVVPEFAVIVVAAPAVFVSEKFTVVTTPETVAATL